MEGLPKDCVECARKERKKQENITKAVNEKYDDQFKDLQRRTNGTNVHGGNTWETVPNPTVHPHEKKIVDGKHPDEDINNAARDAKTTKVYPKGNEPDKNAPTEADHLKE